LSDRTINDDALLQSARDGDHRAFHLLYKRHRHAIFRFLYRLSGSIEVAEDLTHNSFLQLIEKTTLPSTPDPLRHQLYSTARNLAMEQLRHSGLEVDNGLVRKTGQPPLNWRSGKVSAVEVRQAVLGLSLLEREALILSVYEGLEPGEIATIVGTDLDTLAARLERARGFLENSLAR
jgi:RNA polymerase sigma-70 factor (ECF subfamily)